MKTAKLDLTIAEKGSLKKAGVKLNQIGNYAADELGVLLGAPNERAKAIAASITFQSFPSIGPKFAQDLIDMGYFDMAKLKDKDGAELLNEHERFIGYQTDPCVEDQFRLAVYYANNPIGSKQWWDFTPERKNFRAQFGYPDTRPIVMWYDTERYSH
jgi:hypothetical protein